MHDLFCPLIVSYILPRPQRSSLSPSIRRHARPFVAWTSVGAAPVSQRLRDVLDSPDLEVPEGYSAEHMLQVTEAYWKAMKDPKASSKPAPIAVDRREEEMAPDDATETSFDMCIAGGTLGILLALGLQKMGYQVCVVEKRALKGRSQEWNISWKELWRGLVTTGLLTEREVESSIATRWEASNVILKDYDTKIEIRDALNLGVSPKILIEMLKNKFLAAGGTIYERTAFKRATVFKDAVVISLQKGSRSDLMPTDVNRPGALSQETTNGSPPSTAPNRITARVLVDAMGHYSPIVKQTRYKEQPSGMVIVVGGCMEGQFAEDKNDSADLLATIDDSFDDMQLFWESFPAEGGAARTVYMFLYADTHPSRPNFATLLDMFLAMLPRYQGVPLSKIRFKRLLYGGFPCYESTSPLKTSFDRIVQVGDAAAAQGPLSFGGFASMVRHLPRFLRSLDEALSQDRVSKEDLGWLQPYQPSLSVSWLYQKSMRVLVGQLGDDGDSRSCTPMELREWGDSGSGTNGALCVGGGGAERHRSERRGRIPATHINRLMRCNFSVMRALGERVMKPFVLDSMQAGPLALTMMGMMLRDPVAVATVVLHVGPMSILGWFRHFFALVLYRLVYLIVRPLRGLLRGYTFQRLLDALEYGSSSEIDDEGTDARMHHALRNTDTERDIRKHERIFGDFNDGTSAAVSMT